MVGEKPEMEITSENLLARVGKPALYPKDESREEVTLCCTYNSGFHP